MTVAPERLAKALAAVPPLDGSGADLPSTPETVSWGWMPGAGDGPVLEVAPGSVVSVDTVSHEGILGDQGRDPVRFFGGFGVPGEAVLDDAAAIASSPLSHDPSADGPHVVTGPIAVTGARPGDVVSITVLDLVPRVPYGIVSTRHGLGALPGEVIGDDPVFSAFCLVEDGVGSIALRADDPERRARFPLSPFLGFMGVAEAERVHSVAPARHGGNIDVRLLGVGATLHLPVQVPEALVGVGDPHFAQGDGEVALTAFEAPLRASLRLDLVPADEAAARFGALSGPLGETPDLWIPIGLDPDLDEAMRDAVRGSLDLLTRCYGMDRRQAYAYLSVATDYAVSQVVDGTKGVHGSIRKADFR
ncbi:acetamidase/formamidase family protein [Actinomycetospora endophytica]|uniref:Acetamidase/formamidase family protein n=1 Tax=Actinomycetospora endophytica TaxID=2291215 RepID=A0ABS8P948_9PSEU|nr:acetamidase/formamidase family protein [Actinomycetospora endophytica]MCD2194763.1 acetamidase/formamidase family protein [Actinomycetospora endophytica]